MNDRTSEITCKALDEIVAILKDRGFEKSGKSMTQCAMREQGWYKGNLHLTFSWWHGTSKRYGSRKTLLNVTQMKCGDMKYVEMLCFDDLDAFLGVHVPDTSIARYEKKLVEVIDWLKTL